MQSPYSTNIALIIAGVIFMAHAISNLSTSLESKQTLRIVLNISALVCWTLAIALNIGTIISQKKKQEYNDEHSSADEESDELVYSTSTSVE